MCEFSSKDKFLDCRTVVRRLGGCV